MLMRVLQQRVVVDRDVELIVDVVAAVLCCSTVLQQHVAVVCYSSVLQRVLQQRVVVDRDVELIVEVVDAVLGCSTVLQQHVAVVCGSSVLQQCVAAAYCRRP